MEKTKTLETSFCQAQPKPQLSWAELALFSSYTSPPARPASQNSSEIAGNQPNMLFNICRSTTVEVVAALKISKYGRQHQWKMT
jgi:hypothetical protein